MTHSVPSLVFFVDLSLNKQHWTFVTFEHAPTLPDHFSLLETIQFNAGCKVMKHKEYVKLVLQCVTGSLLSGNLCGK